MLKKIYINNYKCLQNFEFNIEELNSAFLLGKNGSGKTTLFEVFEIFQMIGRGRTSLSEMIGIDSFSFSDTKLPIEFEITVEIDNKKFIYELSIEFPSHFHAPKIRNESLVVQNTAVFKRDGGQTYIKEIKEFLLDWHHVGLPLIMVRSENDPLSIFRNWLKNIIILSPCPAFFNKISKAESSTLLRDAKNIIDWARWLLSENPSLYIVISDFLKFRMPDLEMFKFENIGSDDRELSFIFKEELTKYPIKFHQLSDGEKIFFLGAIVIAAQKNNPHLLCLWDEPDNFIGLVELDHFIVACRKAFESSQSQLIMTSHNPQVVHNFSNHNIFLLKRNSHLSPTRIELAAMIPYESKTLVAAFENGELD